MNDQELIPHLFRTEFRKISSVLCKYLGIDNIETAEDIAVDTFFLKISTEAQIGLSLRILCGFGIDEIASAFLKNKETINKRLFRAKEKLRTEKIQIEIPSQTEINRRLETVLTTLYLLFNEGYYSESHDSILRQDLCLEAMRSTYMLIENEQTDLPSVNTLLSLMCFHSSRFEARKNNNGELVLYDEQDESLWNKELISKGVFFLHKASRGDNISKYHLEAGIAYWYTIKPDSKEKWKNIVHLYNQLLIMEYSPIVALNRTYALSKVNGKIAAIQEAEKLNLVNNHFYFTLLGELYREIDTDKAKMNFQKALVLAKTRPDKQIVQKKIDYL
jgi:predicted RNA polymerase sigma factor